VLYDVAPTFVPAVLYAAVVTSAEETLFAAGAAATAA
jgi:hypothetical protein